MPTSTNWSVPWNPFHSFQIKYPLSRVLIGSLFLRFVLYLLYSVVQSSGSHFWRRSGSLHQAFPSLGNIRAFDHIGILEVRMLNKWVDNSEKIAWVAPTANPKKGSRVSMTPTKMKTQVKKGYNKCSRANLIYRDLILKGSKSPFWSKSLTYFNITLHLPSLALTTRLAKTSIVPCVPGFWFIPTKTQHTRLVFASTKLQRKFDGSMSESRNFHFCQTRLSHSWSGKSSHHGCLPSNSCKWLRSQLISMIMTSTKIYNTSK